jgi:hypothetical protein
MRQRLFHISPARMVRRPIPGMALGTLSWVPLFTIGLADRGWFVTWKRCFMLTWVDFHPEDLNIPFRLSRKSIDESFICVDVSI